MLLLAADTLEKLKKCKNPDLNATKECVQAGMAANLKQDYGAAEEERSRVFDLARYLIFTSLR